MSSEEKIGVVLTTLLLFVSMSLIIFGVFRNKQKNAKDRNNINNVQQKTTTKEDVSVSEYFDNVRDVNDDNVDAKENDPFADDCSEVDYGESDYVILSNTVCYK